MPEFPTCRPLISTDAAYIAGLMDAEGSIALNYRRHGRERQLLISLVTSERELLEYLTRTTGVGQITTADPAARSRPASHRWSVSGRRAAELLDQITPYLRTYKARRAQMIQRHYLQQTPRNGYCTEDPLERRQAFCAVLLAAKTK